LNPYEKFNFDTAGQEETINAFMDIYTSKGLGKSKNSSLSWERFDGFLYIGMCKLSRVNVGFSLRINLPKTPQYLSVLGEKAIQQALLKPATPKQAPARGRG